MFREDFEFADGRTPSHVGGAPIEVAVAVGPASWLPDAERELGKIPFFVRGKARRNVERFAADNGLREISVETVYDAKAHFGR
jgi:light-independent protochlorophyllide reductase subunit B